MKRRGVARRQALLCVAMAVALCQPPTSRGDEVYAWMVGARTGWGAGGDTLLFEGDGEISWPGCTADCLGATCRRDQCFSFRAVTGVDLENWAWINESASHCAEVGGCYWMGSDGTYGQLCEECEHNHNYCGSLRRVLVFSAGPAGGDALPAFGCWSVQLLCMLDEPIDCRAEAPGDWCDE